MASTEDEFNETEDFDSYNPHPYQGGYDIALTYGEPLPCSSKTCYPLNTYSPPSSSPPLPLPSPSPSPLPLPSASPLPLPLPSPSPSPLPVHPPLPQPDPYDRGYFGYSPDIYQFGIWPFSEGGNGGCSYGYGYGYGYSAAEEVGYWNPLRRAGDYLFGYSEGLGERRIGVDSYGIPIYADKAQSQQPLTLHFDPPTKHKLDYYETPYTSDRWPSSYVERTEETYGHASYDWHRYEEPVQGKVEMMQPQRLTYHEQVNPQLEWHSSYTKGGSESNFYGQPKDDCERQYSEQHQCIELEPYKPTWSQNLDYHAIYDGEASSQSYWRSSADGGMGDVGGAFGDENHTHETYYYEQSPSLQLEPFKPSWSQNPNFYEQPLEESQSIWVDESKENGNQYFSSFLRYSQYDE